MLQISLLPPFQVSSPSSPIIFEYFKFLSSHSAVTCWHLSHALPLLHSSSSHPLGTWHDIVPHDANSPWSTSVVAGILFPRQLYPGHSGIRPPVGRCRQSVTSSVSLLAAGRQRRSPHVQGKPISAILGDWNHQLGARLCQTTQARSLHLHATLLQLDKGVGRTHAPAPLPTSNNTCPDPHDTTTNYHILSFPTHKQQHTRGPTRTLDTASILQNTPTKYKHNSTKP